MTTRIDREVDHILALSTSIGVAFSAIMSFVREPFSHPASPRERSETQGAYTRPALWIPACAGMTDPLLTARAWNFIVLV